MNLPLGRPFRLVARGDPGSSCDEGGLALGGVPLVWRDAGEGRGRCEVRPLSELSNVLGLAYGKQPPDVVARCHRGLTRVAARLDADDLALASMEAVMIGFPDLTPAAMSALAKLADFEKAGTAWQTEPRIPSGQAGGGQWTAGDSGAGAAPDSASNDHDPAVQGSSGVGAPGRAQTATSPVDGPRSLLDDGVYRPGQGNPSFVPTGGGGPGAAEEGFRQGIGGNEPPHDFMELSELFPGLRNEPGVAVPIAPIDSFLGVSALANEANLEAFLAQYNRLVSQIRAVDPTFRDYELQSFDQMSWQGRNNVLSRLRLPRAVKYYSLRADIRPLQVETLRFLQQAVDQSYEDAVARYKNKKLPVRLSREEAIGTFVDSQVRRDVKRLLSSNGIPFGPSQAIRVNNRDYDDASLTYRVPDASLDNIVFEWSLSFKTTSSAQIRGFFRANANPDAVVVIPAARVGSVFI